MKRTLLCLPLFLAIHSAKAQQVIYSATIDQNDVRAIVSSNGTFFKNYATQNSGYTVPKNSFRNAIYFMNIDMTGYNMNNELKAALSSYEYSDFQSGPIANDYTDSAYMANYGAMVWQMSRAEIDDHIATWNQAGYVPSMNIQRWPGNGNPANGMATQLAPYHDINSDGIYDPLSGDYPIIRGDYAIYSIVNDDKIHQSGAEKMGIEMHLMVYQYEDDNDAINSTTFVHARLINRGTETFYDYKVGSFVDYDLGNFSDDYLGCDPARDLAYCYNGDMNDEPQSGLPGYGEYPPAIGIRYLNQNLNNHFPFNNQGVNTPNPYSPIHVENVFNGMDQTGAPVLDPQGQATPFVYNDIYVNGWNEMSPVTNPSGDRRALISVEPRTFEPNTEFCVDFAVVFATNEDSTFTGAVSHLMEASDEIQAFYDAQGYACFDVSLGIEANTAQPITVYPNPVVSVLHLEGINGVPFQILSTDGKIVFTGTGFESEVNCNFLEAGYYLIMNEKGQRVSFIKE